MSQTTTYVSEQVTSELARDLVGLNQIAVKCSYGRGSRLGVARYFAHMGDVEKVIEGLFFDLDVKELWLAVGAKYQKEMKNILFLLIHRRDHVYVMREELSGVIHNIKFK